MKQIILFKVRIVPYNRWEHCASIVFHIAINLFDTGSLWYPNTYNSQNKNEENKGYKLYLENVIKLTTYGKYEKF